MLRIPVSKEVRYSATWKWESRPYLRTGGGTPRIGVDFPSGVPATSIRSRHATHLRKLYP